MHSNTNTQVDDFLEHAGIKGMKWGVRKHRSVSAEATRHKELIKKYNRGQGKITRSESRELVKLAYRDLNRINKENQSRYDKAAKDPTFKREVKATLKKQGIRPDGRISLQMSRGELLTNRFKGEFKNSQNQKVSEDFANAVLNKAGKKKMNREKAINGAAFLATVGLYVLVSTR